MSTKRVRSRHVAIFCAVLTFLLLVPIMIANRSARWSEGPPVSFDAMRDDQVLVYLGLTRRQESDLKNRYIERPNFVPPVIGAFGNHQIRYFSKAAFPGVDTPGYFFNFWFANYALPELRDHLAYLTEQGKLPSRTVLIQITTPNNDNGAHIADYGNELPFEVLAYGKRYYKDNAYSLAIYAALSLRETLNFTFSYATAIAGAFIGDRNLHVIRQADCAGVAETSASRSSFLQSLNRYMPGTILGAFGDLGLDVLCRPEYLHDSFRNDGSTLAVRVDKLNLNENALDDRARYLDLGDEQRIAQYMRQINDIVSAAGRTAVFLIPPVYETPRPSKVDAIFSRALAMNPDLKVIDDRHFGAKDDYFFNYDHPNEKYFRLVVEQLRQRGWL